MIQQLIGAQALLIQQLIGGIFLHPVSACKELPPERRKMRVCPAGILFQELTLILGFVCPNLGWFIAFGRHGHVETIALCKKISGADADRRRNIGH